MREPWASCGTRLRDSWRSVVRTSTFVRWSGGATTRRTTRRPAACRSSAPGWSVSGPLRPVGVRHREPRHRAGATSVPTDIGSGGIRCLRLQLGTSAGPTAAEPNLLRPLERSWRHWPTVQSRTIASPPGSRPFRRATKHARVLIGKRSTNSGWAARTERLCRVSATSRITRRTPRSRCLARMRRSSAWRSFSRVSASTISSTEGPSITTSALRRSPGIGTGTSARHRSADETRGRRRSMSARWAASRTGEPDGNRPIRRSRPRPAATTAIRSTVTRCSSPRSRRPMAECDKPATAPIAR
jgi:hypothetical protein